MNLASRTLGLSLRRLSADWHVAHGHPLELAETFVDLGRFGTSYMASNWTRVGRAAGHSTPKEIFVRPLRAGAVARLADPADRTGVVVPGDAGTLRGGGAALAARPVRGDAGQPARPGVQAGSGDGAVDLRPRAACRAARADRDETVRARPRPARIARFGGMARRRWALQAAVGRHHLLRACGYRSRRPSRRAAPVDSASPQMAVTDRSPCIYGANRMSPKRTPAGSLVTHQESQTQPPCSEQFRQ